MLRDRYEPDPRFWAIIEQLAIEMEPELAQIDKILGDDGLFQLLKKDLSLHHGKGAKFDPGRSWATNAGGQTSVSVHLSRNGTSRGRQFSLTMVLSDVLQPCARSHDAQPFCSGNQAGDPTYFH